MPKHILKPVQQKRTLLLQKVLKAFSLIDLDDPSEILYSNGTSAYPVIMNLKNMSLTLLLVPLS